MIGTIPRIALLAVLPYPDDRHYPQDSYHEDSIVSSAVQAVCMNAPSGEDSYPHSYF